MRGSTRIKAALTGSLASAAMALAPAQAGAAISVSSSGGELTVSGDAGANTAVADYNLQRPDVIAITSIHGEPIAAAGDCAPAPSMQPWPALEIRCQLAGLRQMRVGLGSGPDSFGAAVHNSAQLMQRVTFPVPIDLDAGPGDDDVQVAGAVSSAHGGPGDDRVLARIGDSVLKGNGGNDRLMAPEGGDDVMFGGGGGDVLESWAGDDRLYGDSGRDVMRAGAGSDRIIADDGGRDKRIRCGPTRGDFARVDLRDPKPQLCEVWKRARRG